jgi:hypothetical protein
MTGKISLGLLSVSVKTFLLDDIRRDSARIIETNWIHAASSPLNFVYFLLPTRRSVMVYNTAQSVPCCGNLICECQANGRRQGRGESDWKRIIVFKSLSTQILSQQH